MRFAANPHWEHSPEGAGMATKIRNALLWNAIERIIKGVVPELLAFLILDLISADRGHVARAPSLEFKPHFELVLENSRFANFDLGGAIGNAIVVVFGRTVLRVILIIEL